MKRHIEAAGMIVTNTSNFTIMHTEHSAMRQVRVAKSKLDIIKDANLRRGMDEYLQDLERRLAQVVTAAGGRIPMSFDYVMAVELANAEETSSQANSAAIASSQQDLSGSSAVSLQQISLDGVTVQPTKTDKE
jgi:hypothetical protein